MFNTGSHYKRGISLGLFFALQTLVAVGFAVIINDLLGNGRRLLTLLVFSGLYSLLHTLFSWVLIHSKNYHIYLRASLGLLIRATAITAVVYIGFALLFIYGFYGILPSPAFQSSELTEYASILAIIAGGSSLIASILIYIALFAWIRNLATVGFFKKRILYIGDRATGDSIINAFIDFGRSRKIVCSAEYRNGFWYAQLSGQPHREIWYSSIQELIYTNHIGEVLVLNNSAPTSQINRVLDFCEGNHIVYSVVDPFKLRSHRGKIHIDSILDGLSRRTFNRDTFSYVSLKRLADLVITSLAFVVLLPVFGLVALLIWLEDRGPALYVSTRIGVHGRKIKFYKFRSMVMDAEKKKAELLHLNQRKDGPLFKLDNDPRITKIGHFIRKTSIDELPQMINVLKGDMSIIGPRPHLPNEVQAYTTRDHLRLECIPGIACLPQIYGRDTLGFRDWVELDLLYRKQASLYKDAWIFVRALSVSLYPILRRIRPKKPVRTPRAVRNAFRYQPD
ncbi:sugar transferase [Spirochaeta lutea]|uniref:sugar transferase n=1 Tax=Spirochaeta lutea TaxID=1480694 RepID=UPI00068A649D|nr:sugar transferase [Spirochaeta lutea]